MRLTVGPLPPAVYWRRRAVVLGAILLFVLVLLYSCAGSGRQPANPTGAGSTRSPSPGVLTPQIGASSPSGRPGSAAPTATGSTVPSMQSQPTAGQASGGGDGCTDAEIELTGAPAQNTVAAGASLAFTLRIKNTSSRTCSRDLGSLQQELYLKRGAQTIWSSDTCGNGRDSDVKSLAPNIVHEYRIDWNGRDSSRCAGGVASGPAPAAGGYLLFARLGSKLSEPAALTISGA